MDVSQRIRHFREKAKKSQAGLARDLEVDRSTVCRWEMDPANDDARTPSLEQIARITQTLGVSQQRFWSTRIPKRRAA